MGKRNPSLRLAQSHNDSLPGMRSVMEAIVSRGGVLSTFSDSTNKISVSVFTTSVAAIENPKGTTGLNNKATSPKPATQRYSCSAAAWNMTTVAAAGIRISKPAWYPAAKRPMNAGSKRPPRRAALAIHFMNFVSIGSSLSTSSPTKGSADRGARKSQGSSISGAPAPLCADLVSLAQSCNQQDDGRNEEHRHRDCEICVACVHLDPLCLSHSGARARFVRSTELFPEPHSPSTCALPGCCQ